MAAFNILELKALSMRCRGSGVNSQAAGRTVVNVIACIANFLRGSLHQCRPRRHLVTPNGWDRCYYVLALMTFIAAFDQLTIKFRCWADDSDRVRFAGVDWGLAVRAGRTEVVGGILAGYYTRQRLQTGDTVSRGRFRRHRPRSRPVATIIETATRGS